MTRSKNWSLAAVVLLAIGLAGMAYQHFRSIEPLKDYQHRWELGAGRLDNLSVISGSSAADVSFVSSKDGTSYVELSGKLKPEIFDRLNRTEAGNGGLQIDLTSDSFSFFNLDFRSPKSKITVALPDSTKLGRFELQMSSGSASIQGLRAETADLKTSSGRLSVLDAETSTLHLKASSGDIIGERITGSLQVKMSSGSLKMHDITGSGTYTLSSGSLKGTGINGNVNIKMSSGQVTLDDWTGSGQIKAGSGNITLDGQRSDSLDITTHSGNIKLSQDEAFRGDYDLKTGSGSILAPEAPKETDDLVKIRTQSGNITIK